MKKCTKCKQEKEDSEFHMNNSNSDGLSFRCKNCVKEHNRQNAKYIADRLWANKLWNEYGITPIQYELMLKAQGGVCKICGQPETKKQHGKIQRLSADHCHKTFKNRGLLCFRCNIQLRLLEDPNWTPKAQAYIEEYK